MVSEINELLRCKAVIERKLDWGPADSWQTADFEALSEAILQQTGVSLSTSTLRRIWGRVEYNHLPSGTTLNTLARFAGSEDWRSFVKGGRQTEADMTIPDEVTDPPVAAAKPGRARLWRTLAGIATVVLALIVVSMLAFDKGEPQLQKKAYTFGSQPVTRGIPNSVIFTYDATASPTDSVFIQQSWDASKKVLVDKTQHKHTAVYYEPGVYKAKLQIGDQVVQEHRLVIGTQGWSALIENAPVPVYLKESEFVGKGTMGADVKTIENKNLRMQPEAPLIKFFNVGNFEPVALGDFAFSSEVKNEYSEGAAACQLTYISLITDDTPIVIPLSVKGCVSDLNLMSVDDYLSGKKADLSALGVNFFDWVRVSCTSSGGTIRYAINDVQAFEFPVPKRPIKILGVAFGFRGTGSVRKIALSSEGKEVFHAF